MKPELWDALDARHPGPPAWQVVRVADQAPDVLRRGGHVTAASGPRHRYSKVISEWTA